MGQFIIKFAKSNSVQDNIEFDFALSEEIKEALEPKEVSINGVELKKVTSLSPEDEI